MHAFYTRNLIKSISGEQKVEEGKDLTPGEVKFMYIYKKTIQKKQTFPTPAKKMFVCLHIYIYTYIHTYTYTFVRPYPYSTLPLPFPHPYLSTTPFFPLPFLKKK